MIRQLAWPQWSRSQLAVVSGSAFYALLFIVVLVVHPGSERFYRAFYHASGPQAHAWAEAGEKSYKEFFNIYQIIAPFFATICCIAYALRGGYASGVRRAGWWLIGLGCLSFTLGQTAWTYYESFVGETPSPGPADIGYVGSYPLILAGVILLFGSMAIAGRARLLLDSALAAASVGVLSWHFLIQPLWNASNDPAWSSGWWGKVVGVAYPLGDVSMLLSAIVLINAATISRSLRRSAWFLAIGIVMFSLADSAYTYYTLIGKYQTGSWFDWGWSFGWMLVGWAALLRLWGKSEIVGDAVTGEATASAPAFHAPGLAVLVTPYVATGIALGMIAFDDYRQHGVLGTSIFSIALGLVMLVMLRQVSTVLENHYLANQLRAFNVDLERMVARRTEQLTALHELTKAVNHSLRIEHVLQVAATHTRRALRADAISIRLLQSEMPELDGSAPSFLQQELDDYPAIVEFLTQLSPPMRVENISLPRHVHHIPTEAEKEVTGKVAPELAALSADRAAEAAESGTGEEEFWAGGRKVCLRAALMWRDHPIGTIAVIRWEDGFDEADARLIEGIGVEVGAALANARLYAIALEAADRDPVTALLNHRAVHERMEAEFHRASRQNRPLSVMMMDVNNFKLFNDTYGHPIGDQVLKRVARILEEECRKCDIIGRYGGDEFLVVLPDTDTAMSLVVAQRLHDCIGHEGFQRGDDERTIPVTLSFGVATYPHDSINRHELLTVADANLYRAKMSDSGIVGTSQAQRDHRELRLEDSFGVLDAMVTAVDNKDRYTRQHSEDVTEYALWIATEMGLSDETMRIVRIGGLLHDVGKIGIPEDILRKPGRLTDEEFEVIKRHPQLGALIVSGVPGMDAIVDIVRSHHERWDGKGYPDGLDGADIPLLGRVMAVADAFSAMTTSRAYRKGMDWDVAMGEIRKNMGTQFDPAAANAFLTAAARRRSVPDTQTNAHLQLVPSTGRAA